MSTPHKLNVTFWDMPEEEIDKPLDIKSGVKKVILEPIGRFLRPHPVRFGLSAALLLLSWLADVAGFVLPFLAVAAVHFWHATLQRGKLTPGLTHAIFCASIFGEILSAAAVDNFWLRTGIHSSVLFLTSLFVGKEPTLMLYAGCRFFLWASVPGVPDTARGLLGYACAVLGTMAAKYVEVFLMAQILPDLKLSAPRRRRSSNNTVFNVYKMRRTSLPALGGKASHHPFGYQHSHLLRLIAASVASIVGCV
ncbi:hypothetical protein JTE90_026267 [Oedothorax gibbosus]|uniref:Uncharacterized protein n=1 Tax=Oedothorax gibbosus TaxID=931172 RepID=A0AAV6U2Q6_9ARAC|nr:hypothetical protein JTE90_026267 [Oedothorax gibbosus]